MDIYDKFNLYESFHQSKHIHYNNGKIEDFTDVEVNRIRFTDSSKVMIFDARELLHKDWLKQRYRVMQRVLRKVDPNQITYVINFHSTIPDQEINDYYNKKFCIKRIRYFESECVNVHKKHESNSIQNLFKHTDKKCLALFGKAYKFMRIGAFLQLEKQDKLDDFIISCLSGTKENIDHAVSLTVGFDKNECERILRQYNYSPDNVDYDQGLANSDTNYKGYPYDKNLYTNTFVSLIAETQDIRYPKQHGPNFFITEKTARTMYNYHPFIILSNVNYLKNLKSLGYKTFSNYCDESYDSEEDDYLRLNKALDALEELKNCKDKGLQEIVQHNFLKLTEVYEMEKNMLLEHLYA